MTMAAGYSEILIAQYKDEEYIEGFSAHISNIMKEIFEERFIQKYEKWLPLISSLLYFTSTNLFGLQTLGEEYSGLVQTTPNRELPPFWRRILYIIFVTISKKEIFALYKCLRNLSSKLTADIRNLFEIMFFAFGAYKRYIAISLAGISYLSARSYCDMFPATLSHLTVLSTLINYYCLFIFKIMQKKKRVRHESVSIVGKHKNVCKICSSTRQQVCFPCGHTYCFSCLYDSTDDDMKVRCAFCRKTSKPSRLIPLLNF